MIRNTIIYAAIAATVLGMANVMDNDPDRLINDLITIGMITIMAVGILLTLKVK